MSVDLESEFKKKKHYLCLQSNTIPFIPLGIIVVIFVLLFLCADFVSRRSVAPSVGGAVG